MVEKIVLDELESGGGGVRKTVYKLSQGSYIIVDEFKNVELEYWESWRSKSIDQEELDALKKLEEEKSE